MPNLVFQRLQRPHRWLLLLVWCLSGAALAQTPSVEWPGRIVRLSHVEGLAQVLMPGRADWTPLDPAIPLIGGAQIATEPGSRAELHSGSTAMRVEGRTRLGLGTLDDLSTQLQITEGTLSVRVRALVHGERVEFNTPNLAFLVGQPGEYRIDLDPARGWTRLTLHSGSGTVYGEQGETRVLSAPQQIIFAGRQLAMIQVQTPGLRDAFDQWVAQRDLSEERSISARYVSREVIGYQQLDAWGEWRTDPTYGAVWLPRVTIADWAPYRYGRWTWVDPWGWTWVDDAPWGFAPFHYGRWALIGGRWAWVPGPTAVRPAYAPALVGFVGLSGGSGSTGWSIGLNFGGPAVGWFPLGPGEPWRPGYDVHPRYLERVNPGWPYRDWRDREPDYRYRQHPGAISIVPADRFGRSRHGDDARPPRLIEREGPRLPIVPPPPPSDSRVRPAPPPSARPPAPPVSPTPPRAAEPVRPVAPPAAPITPGYEPKRSSGRGDEPAPRRIEVQPPYPSAPPPPVAPPRRVEPAPPAPPPVSPADPVRRSEPPRRPEVAPGPASPAPTPGPRTESPREEKRRDAVRELEQDKRSVRPDGPQPGQRPAPPAGRRTEEPER